MLITASSDYYPNYAGFLVLPKLNTKKPLNMRAALKTNIKLVI